MVASISKSVAPDFLKAQNPSNFFVPGLGVEEKLSIMERSNFIFFFFQFYKKSLELLHDTLGMTDAV